MQPHAGRAGTAVERERDRSARGVLAVRGVGGHEHLRLGLRPVELVLGMALLPEYDPPGGGRVAQIAALERDRVVRGDQVVDRFAGIALAILPLAAVGL